MDEDKEWGMDVPGRFIAEIELPGKELEYWDTLLKMGRMPRLDSCSYAGGVLYVRKVRYSDGSSAHVRVRHGSLWNGFGEHVWAEMAWFDESGNQRHVSEPKRWLSGPWHIDVGDTSYHVLVKPEDLGESVYDELGCSRDTLVEMLESEVGSMSLAEEREAIAEAIVDKVAEDIAETADPSEWNSSDVAIGARRVILKALGVDA